LWKRIQQSINYFAGGIKILGYLLPKPESEKVKFVRNLAKGKSDGETVESTVCNYKVVCYAALNKRK